MTLRVKIIGWALIILLVVAAATIGLVRFVIADRIESELIKRGGSIARHLASSSQDPILTENSISLQQLLLESLQNEEDVVYIFILDRRGRALAHTFELGFPTALRDVNVLEGGEGESVEHYMLEGEEIYDIAVPIARGQLGTVRLGFRTVAVKTGLRSVTELGALIIILVLLAAGAIAVAIDTAIIQPLSVLTGTAREIGGGRFDKRVDDSGGDEIGTLGKAFNRMMGYIEESRNELIVANEELEGEIVERRAAETRVREREHELRTIFESSPVLMALIDKKGNIRKLNRSWVGDNDGSVDENSDRRIGTALGCIHSLREDGGCGEGEKCGGCYVRKTILTAMEQGVQLRQVEGMIPLDKGRQISLLISATPIAVSGETLILVSIEDVTPLKRTEVELKEALRELEQQNEELKKVDVIRSSIIRDVSHELKTPVAKFVMQHEMLKSRLVETDAPGDVHLALQSIRENLLRQQSVIRNILNLSRLEKGGRPYRKETFRLDGLVEEALKEFGLLIEGKGLQVDMDLEAVSVESDSEMLWHVFSNILGNAVKYTLAPNGGRIKVSLKKEGPGAVVRVEDNGVGLGEEERERIFDPFFQSSASREGIGVGLTLCRMIMDDLGGEVSLESEGRGKGATASVILPLTS